MVCVPPAAWGGLGYTLGVRGRKGSEEIHGAMGDASLGYGWIGRKFHEM